MAINTQEIQGQWNQLRGRVKERWGQLTDDDLQIQAGNFDQLVGRIQQKTGEGREAIEKFFSDMTSRGSSAVAHAAEAAGRYAHQVGDQVRDRYDNAEGVVRHHPAETVVAVLGIGLVAGLIVGLAIRPLGLQSSEEPLAPAASDPKPPAQERHRGHSTQVADGPSGRRDLPHPGGHRRDVAGGRGAEAPGPGGTPQLRTGATGGIPRAASGAAGHRGPPHGRPCARVLGRDRLRRRAAALLAGLPTADYQARIQQKVDFLTPSDDTAFYRAQKVAGDVARSLDTPVVAGHEAMNVRVIDEPTFRQRLQGAVGPYLEFIGVSIFVLILVLFMLMNREALGDRIVQLFGPRRSTSRPGP